MFLFINLYSYYCLDMIDLRKENFGKTYNKFVDLLSDEQKARMAEISDEKILKMMAEENFKSKAQFDPKNPKESDFFTKLSRIVSTPKPESIEDLRAKMINKIMKDKEDKSAITIQQPLTINDAIKKINLLMKNISANSQYVSNTLYVNALTEVSSLLIDVKTSIEARDKKLLKGVFELPNGVAKGNLIELLED